MSKITVKSTTRETTIPIRTLRDAVTTVYRSAKTGRFVVKKSAPRASSSRSISKRKK